MTTALTITAGVAAKLFRNLAARNVIWDEMIVRPPHQRRMKSRAYRAMRPYYLTEDRRMPGYQKWRNQVKRWAPLN